MRQGIEDVVFCYLRFPSGLAAHLHLSWLDPHKERRFTVVGSKQDGDLRRHGARAQADRLRQGLRRGLLLVRRVHRALGRHLQPARPRTRSRCGSSAGTSSSACATAREPRSGAASRAARGAGAGGAAALARGEHAACVQRRLTARPACCSATDVELPDDVELGAGVVIHAGTRDRRRVRGCRTAAWSASRWRSGRRRARRAMTPPPAVVGAGCVVGAQAVVVAGAALGGRRAWWATRRTCASARRSARQRWSGAAASVENDVVDRRARADPDRRLRHRLLA